MGFNRIPRLYLTPFIPYVVEKERIHCDKKEFSHKKKKYLLQTDNKNKQTNKRTISLNIYMGILRWGGGKESGQF